MMLDTAPPRDFYESKSDDEEADIFQQIDEWISALEEVSDDDLRSWIEVLEERGRDGPRDNEEVGWLKAMKDEMTGRNPYGSIPSNEEIQKLYVQEMRKSFQDTVDQYNENYAYPFESPVEPDTFSTPVGKKLIFIDLTESD